MKKPKPFLYRNPRQESHRIHAAFHNVRRVIPDHWHNFLELEIVVDGEGEQIFKNARQPLHRGVILLTTPAEYHRLEPKDQLKILNISFDEKLISKAALLRIFTAKNLFFDKLSPEEFDVLERLGQLLVLESQSAAPNLAYVQSLLSGIFIKLHFEPPTDRERRPTPIQLAVQYLRAHFEEDPSLTELAAVVGYNSEYLSALFRKEVGLTYSEYLANLKLSHAKTLLLNTDHNLEYIGMQCGFGSYSSFLRTFRQKYNASPGEYRKARRTQSTAAQG